MEANQERWEFRVYIAGNTYRSQQALANLKKYCSQYLADNFGIEVIDLTVKPHLAEVDQILAVPTVVRSSPHPIRKVIGDLANDKKVLASLGFSQLAD